MPYLVSTLDVSEFAEMLSANIVSRRLGCARIWFASKEPTDSLQPHFQTLAVCTRQWSQRYLDYFIRDLLLICLILGTDLRKLYNKLSIFVPLLLLVLLLNSGILIFAKLAWPRTCKKPAG